MLLDIGSWVGGLGLGIIIISLILLVIYIWVIVDIVRRPELSGVLKLIWIAVVVFFPVIGVILYFLIGKRNLADKRNY